MTVILGIDPGTSPSMALVCSERGWLEYADEDMVSVKVSKTKRRPVAALMAQVIRDWQVLEDIDGVALEKVASMSGQGIASTAEFLRGAGIAEGIAAGFGFRCSLITPPKWKRHLGLITLDKDASRLKALEFWPERADWARLKKHHNRCEAALIAKTMIDLKIGM